MSSTAGHEESLRAAEVIAPVCLATDLGMGFPLEHGLGATVMAMRFCDLIEVDHDTSKQVYFACMLMYAGCTAESALGKPVLSWPATETLVPYLFGDTLQRARGFLRALPPHDGPLLARAAETARRVPRLIANSREQQTTICEVAQMLSARLGLPDDVHELFAFLTERWDGKSVLRRARGDEIPMAVRIVVMMRDLAFQYHWRGEDHAIDTARARAGQAFDPDLAKAFVNHASDVFSALDSAESVWDRVLSVEPKPWVMLEDEAIDKALASIGDFADMVSPSLSGHSRSLADLVAGAARIAGMSPEDIRDVRRAAYVHDVGRVAISSAIWGKAGPLSRDEHEQVRLHPYHTERVLSESSFFTPIRLIARDHHENLDGSGYHRGVDAQALSPQARLLAAADRFQALTEPRPYRQHLDGEEATRLLASVADEGALDPASVTAVIEAAGQTAPPIGRPGGLTEREAQVIGLLSRGLQTKQVATALGISPKTADTHIQSAYRKMGVSTRAAATLFAMEHGLVASGELPMVGKADDS